MSPGAICFRKLPTALTEMIRSTPSFFMAKILARKLISVGNQRWPFPWRGRKANSVSPRFPLMNFSDGLPNGVLISTSRIFLSPSI